VFYDINPLVVRFCRKYFTFLEGAEARGASVEIRQGDARLVMEEELSQGRTGAYDILVVDAFSSDSIPIHLLTRECFDVYSRHVQDGGILAFHISNRYVDLRPVICRHATDQGFLSTVVNRGPIDPELGRMVSASDWVLVCREQPTMDRLSATGRTEKFDVPASFRTWTDDFNSIFDVLR
jgi:hypothetical protein